MIGNPLAAVQHQREKLLEQLPGAWQLLEFDHIAKDRGESTVLGAMIVTDGLMSLTIHATAPEFINVTADRLVQSGIYYWRISEDLRFESSSLMAHSNMDGGPLTIEAPFVPSIFEIDMLTPNDLMLIRRDGSRLMFRRMDSELFPLEAQKMVELLKSGKVTLEQMRLGQRPR